MQRSCDLIDHALPGYLSTLSSLSVAIFGPVGEGCGRRQRGGNDADQMKFGTVCSVKKASVRACATGRVFEGLADAAVGCVGMGGRPVGVGVISSSKRTVSRQRSPPPLFFPCECVCALGGVCVCVSGG